MKKRVISALIVLWWMCGVLSFISCTVLDIGTDNALYFKEQMRAGVLETAGVSEENLWHLDERLAACLNGQEYWNDSWEWDGAEKPYHIMVDGVEQNTFNAREIAHMEDCARLFDLLRTVQRILYAVVLLMTIVIGVLIRISEEEYNFSALAWIGSLILIVPLAIFGIWAAIDFNSAFNFFHRLLFTNDLWLLNPETDLLIRICPASMFANMGLRIALRAAAMMLGIPLLGTLLQLILKRVNERKRKRHETVEL